MKRTKPTAAFVVGRLRVGVLVVGLLGANAALEAATKPRARDLGVPFEGK